MIDLVSFVNKLLDFIYKKKCYFCGSSKECVKMCSSCYQELTHSDLRVNRVVMGVEVYSAGVYEKYLQKLIRGIKYHKQTELGYYMSKFMWEYFDRIIEKYGLCRDFQVVPVPMHPKREKKRGYNHMDIVGKEFCSISGFKLNSGLVKRIKQTKPQYKLSYKEKLKNLENAFVVDGLKDMNKPVLIIDDICTSGATLSSMIKELKANGISNIVCLSASSPDFQ